MEQTRQLKQNHRYLELAVRRLRRAQAELSRVVQLVSLSIEMLVGWDESEVRAVVRPSRFLKVEYRAILEQEEGAYDAIECVCVDGRVEFPVVGTGPSEVDAAEAFDRAWWCALEKGAE